MDYFGIIFVELRNTKKKYQVIIISLLVQIRNWDRLIRYQLSQISCFEYVYKMCLLATFVIVYQSTLCHTVEKCKFNIHSCDNIKSHDYVAICNSCCGCTPLTAGHYSVIKSHECGGER